MHPSFTQPFRGIQHFNIIQDNQFTIQRCNFPVEQNINCWKQGGTYRQLMGSSPLCVPQGVRTSPSYFPSLSLLTDTHFFPLYDGHQGMMSGDDLPPTTPPTDLYSCHQSVGSCHEVAAVVQHLTLMLQVTFSCLLADK